MERSMEVAAFLSSLEAKGLSPNTVSAYRHDIESYLGWYTRDGKKDILGTSPRDISDYCTWLKRKKKAASTRARRISTLKNFFEWERMRGLIPTNPVTGIKGIKVIRKNPSYACEEEIAKLRAVIDTRTYRGMRDMAMLELCFTTGLNVSDIIGLKVGDLDIKRKKIMPDGGSGRSIALGRDALRYLRAYLSDARPHLAAERSGEDTLFLSLKGAPLTRQGVWKNLRVYSEEAGIDNVTPVALRHGFAIRALMDGESPEDLSKKLGLRSRSSVAEYSAIAAKMKQ